MLCLTSPPITHYAPQPPTAGRKYRRVLELDDSQVLAMINWGRVVGLRADLGREKRDLEVGGGGALSPTSAGQGVCVGGSHGGAAGGPGTHEKGPGGGRGRVGRGCLGLAERV